MEYERYTGAPGIDMPRCNAFMTLHEWLLYAGLILIGGSLVITFI